MTLRQLDGSLLDARPGLAQVGNVFGQLGIGRVFTIGAQMKPPPPPVDFVAHQRL